MQTIQFEYQVNNDVYENFLQSGQEIKDKVKEFLLFELNMFEDNSLSIGTEEAKKRVADAVEHYREHPEDFVPYSKGMDKIDKWLESL